MAGSVLTLVDVLSWFGFDWALMRVADRTSAHYNTAWTLRVISGIVIFSLLLAAAFPSAIYFRQPAVTGIIIAQGAISLIGSFDNIGIVDFRLQMRFDREFQLRVTGKFVGAVVAVALALITHSYWALVIGMAATRSTMVLMSYGMHEFRPRWDLSRRADILNFSVWLLVGNLADTLSGRFADLWLGRNIGPSSVGKYAMATEFSALATTELAAPINRAVYTRYLDSAHDLAGLRDAFLRVSGIIWVIGFPASLGLGICAHQIVSVLLGAQWSDAALVLQVLSAAGLINIMSANTHYVYWALGRSKFVTLLSLVGAAGFVVFTIILGGQFGLIGVAGAQVLASALVLVLNYSALFRTLQLRFIQFAHRCSRVVLASALMTLAVLWFGRVIADTIVAPALQLLAMASVGISVYALSLAAFWQLLGRPDGPEHDALKLLQGAIGRWS